MCPHERRQAVRNLPRLELVAREPDGNAVASVRHRCRDVDSACDASDWRERDRQGRRACKYGGRSRGPVRFDFATVEEVPWKRRDREIEAGKRGLKMAR